MACGRWTWVLLMGVALTGGGCTSTGGGDDRELRQRRAEQDRDAAREQLRSVEAREAALRRELQDAQAELKLARMETGHLQDQLKALDTQYRELKDRVEGLKSRELKRPEIPASPLPASVDEALLKLVERFGDRVAYERTRGAVSFANERLFEPGSDRVRADAHAVLKELAGVLAGSELADFEVVVVGHTDASPITRPETLEKHPTNWHLSVHRAIAVKDVLVADGLPADRVGVMGYGDQRPASGDAARNRRVEVFVVRRGGVQGFEPVRLRG